jgi:NTE family protein
MPRKPAAPMKLDGVFEGGGVKGIALVGALAVIEDAGYELVNVAGTSAGAIVAALVAAGYTAAEIKPIIMGLDFSKITDTSGVGKLPVVGSAIEILTELGIYDGDYLLNLMRKLLADKGKHTFADLVIPEYATEVEHRYRAQVVASDVSRGSMLFLPRDITAYRSLVDGRRPSTSDELEIALAVRMSMSIPYFFKPVRLKNNDGETSYVVDGGLLSDFPVGIFDDPGEPGWPTFGFHLVDPGTAPVIKHQIHGPISMFGALFETMMNAHDARYIQAHDFVRTIPISNLGVSTTNFNLSPADKEALYQSGVTAATDFLKTWDFDAYKRKYRGGAPLPHRREQVL